MGCAMQTSDCLPVWVMQQKVMHLGRTPSRPSRRAAVQPCRKLWALRGHPGVQKHYRTPRTIPAIKLCYVFHSQPLTHGLVGYWSPSTFSRRQMNLVCPCLAMHHHKHSVLRVSTHCHNMRLEVHMPIIDGLRGPSPSVPMGML